MHNRLAEHMKEQLKRIPNDKDKQCFYLALKHYSSMVTDRADLGSSLSDLQENHSIMNESAYDSFFKGKAKTMDMLAYETVRQVVESEIKKAGG
jgi:hypothetical protein